MPTNVEKMRKIADSEIFLWTRCVVDANLQMQARCIVDADYLPTSMLDTSEKLLGNLWEQQLFVKASKYKILKTSIEFRGQQINRGGMTRTAAKLKAV